MHLDDDLSEPSHRSRRGLRLACRLQELESGLHLEQVPNTQADVDRIHSYRVLAHAEIQAFLEGIATDIIDVSETRYVANSSVTHALHHLVVHHAMSKSLQPRDAAESRYPRFSMPRVLTVTTPEVQRAIRAHRDRVDRNSGIKQSNVHAVFHPLGYRDSWFQAGFLDQLSALGTARGNVAHGSGIIGVSLWPSGQSEIARIRGMLPALYQVDKYASRLLLPV